MAKGERGVGPGCVAVVTGASSGIGHATALAFARRGARVLAVARREERLRALAGEMERHAPGSGYLAGDLSERGFAERAIDEAWGRYARLDVLVNNAGVPFRKLVYRIRPEEVERTLRINFLSCVWTTFAAIPFMLRSGGGTVVNVSSFASKVVPPHEAVYAASKAALSAFTEGLWSDLRGSGIHAALVHPGPIETEIWDKGTQPHRYSGPKYPAELVADAILDAVEKRRHEVTVPRRNPSLVAARLLRLVAPSLLRLGMARMDAVTPAQVEEARKRAHEGRRLGS